MAEPVQSLAEAFPVAQARVRQILAYYQACGPGAGFAVAHIQATLTEAEQAVAQQDVLAMLRAYAALQALSA